MGRSLLALLLVPSVVLAQAATVPGASVVFGDHPVQYKNSELDHRFGRSQVATALAHGGSDDPNCAVLLTGLLSLLADAAPALHVRDENYTVSPPMVRALQTQLTIPGFPASTFLSAMVRDVFLNRKLPEGWLSTAKKLDPTGTLIDLAKLRFLDEGLHPIDSMYFTFPYLLQRYDIEVKRANSAVAANAFEQFRETYLDHQIAWDGLTLLDITRETVKQASDDGDADPQPALIAHLEIRPQDPYKDQPLAAWFHKKKPRPWLFTARLKPEQFLDLSRLPKGTKVVVRGRLFDFDERLTHFEIRDALLFQDRSAQPVQFATRQQIAKCPMAIDEINGIAPKNPGGWEH